MRRSRWQGLRLAEPLAEGTEWSHFSPPKLCVFGSFVATVKELGMEEGQEGGLETQL